MSDHGKNNGTCVSSTLVLTEVELLRMGGKWVIISQWLVVGRIEVSSVTCISMWQSHAAPDTAKSFVVFSILAMVSQHSTLTFSILSLRLEKFVVLHKFVSSSRLSPCQ